MQKNTYSKDHARHLEAQLQAKLAAEAKTNPGPCYEFSNCASSAPERDVPEIPRQMHALADRLQYTYQLMESLELRIAPVRRIANGCGNPAQGAAHAERPIETSLGGDLFDITEKLQVLNGRMYELLESLEV
jgi:hypothetical protein